MANGDSLQGTHVEMNLFDGGMHSLRVPSVCEDRFREFPIGQGELLFEIMAFGAIAFFNWLKSAILFRR